MSKSTPSQSESNKNPARRRLLKTLAASGAVASVKLVPEKWVKPVVDAALLPAHAQASTVCNVVCGVSVSLSWARTVPGSEVDLDLEMITAGGTRIAPKGAIGPRMGRCLLHEGDSVANAASTASFGREHIHNINDSLISPGRYQIFVRNSGLQSSSFRLRVRACGVSQRSIGSSLGADALGAFGSINISANGTATVNIN